MSLGAINRDAGISNEGVRLQRLRALNYLFDVFEISDTALVYAAIEAGDDVNVIASTSAETTQVFEQNKSYAPSTGFSFQSENVLKSLSNFLQCWASKDFSKQVYFCFYCTNRIAKERATALSASLEITFPEKPLLELLIGNDYVHIEIIKKILLKYVDDNKSLSKAICDSLAKWANSDWTDFFKRIKWSFLSQDTDNLESSLVERVKKSKYWKGHTSTEKAEIIISRLLDMLDQRQSLPTASERFIYGADVKVTFLEVTAGTIKTDDPSWELFKSIPKTDQRGLSDKIKAVCETFPLSKIGTLSRKAASGMLLHEKSKEDKRILSVRYRVYDVCQEALAEYVELEQNVFSEAEIEAKLTELVALAERKITELSKDFSYPVTNSESLREIMLELIDSCYLSFNKGGQSE